MDDKKWSILHDIITTPIPSDAKPHNLFVEETRMQNREARALIRYIIAKVGGKHLSLNHLAKAFSSNAHAISKIDGNCYGGKQDDLKDDAKIRRASPLYGEIKRWLKTTQWDLAGTTEAAPTKQEKKGRKSKTTNEPNADADDDVASRSIIVKTAPSRKKGRGRASLKVQTPKVTDEKANDSESDSGSGSSSSSGSGEDGKDDEQEADPPVMTLRSRSKPTSSQKPASKRTVKVALPSPPSSPAPTPAPKHPKRRRAEKDDDDQPEEAIAIKLNPKPSKRQRVRADSDPKETPTQTLAQNLLYHHNDSAQFKRVLAFFTAIGYVPADLPVLFELGLRPAELLLMKDKDCAAVHGMLEVGLKGLGIPITLGMMAWMIAGAERKVWKALAKE
ncbi:hypothetical protein GALMADRAFT_227108 [Galerina marginata CBS 339.88]|uniref:Uncharacterized protein n=1 Tax=Galerina marginata (strain CBS 339.88) TaxID=685588 RepID=A0A067T3X0_GALM3|nr:hypothetical protein GALMADRAFT_227108 [Galerina marginata CBS 339.88]